MTRRAMLDDSDITKRLIELLAQKCPELHEKVLAGKMHVDAAAVLAGIPLPERPKPTVPGVVPSSRRSGSTTNLSAPSGASNGSDGLLQVARKLYQVADPKTREKLKEIWSGSQI